MVRLCDLRTLILYMDIPDPVGTKFYDVNSCPVTRPMAALRLQHAVRIKCKKSYCIVDALPKDNCGKV